MASTMPGNEGADQVRVGDLAIRRVVPAESSSTYRAWGAGKLEIERRAETDTSRPLPGPVTLLIGVLCALLLAFAAYARSYPAIGAVSFTLLALTVMVMRSSRRRPPPSDRLELGEGRLVARGANAMIDASLDDVRAVGMGRDAALQRTVWVSLGAGGRALLLDGLSEPEAEACAEALRDALARFAASPALPQSASRCLPQPASK